MRYTTGELCPPSIHCTAMTLHFKVNLFLHYKEHKFHVLGDALMNLCTSVSNADDRQTTLCGYAIENEDIQLSLVNKDMF